MLFCWFISSFFVVVCSFSTGAAPLQPYLDIHFDTDNKFASDDQIDIELEYARLKQLEKIIKLRKRRFYSPEIHSRLLLLVGRQYRKTDFARKYGTPDGYILAGEGNFIAQTFLDLYKQSSYTGETYKKKITNAVSAYLRLKGANKKSRGAQIALRRRFAAALLGSSEPLVAKNELTDVYDWTREGLRGISWLQSYKIAGKHKHKHTQGKKAKKYKTRQAQSEAAQEYLFKPPFIFQPTLKEYLGTMVKQRSPSWKVYNKVKNCMLGEMQMCASRRNSRIYIHPRLMPVALDNILRGAWHIVRYAYAHYTWELEKNIPMHEARDLVWAGLTRQNWMMRWVAVGRVMTLEQMPPRYKAHYVDVAAAKCLGKMR